jgi:hypothetical protein
MMRSRFSRAITRCLMTSMRSSAKEVTADCTMSVGICCDSTRTVPADRYTGGIASTTATPTARAAAKVPRISQARRWRIAT